MRRRSAASASRDRVKAFSFKSSCWRAVSHSSCDTIGGVFIARFPFPCSFPVPLLVAILISPFCTEMLTHFARARPRPPCQCLCAKHNQEQYVSRPSQSSKAICSRRHFDSGSRSHKGDAQGDPISTSQEEKKTSQSLVQKIISGWEIAMAGHAAISFFARSCQIVKWSFDRGSIRIVKVTVGV